MLHTDEQSRALQVANNVVMHRPQIFVPPMPQQHQQQQQAMERERELQHA